MWSEIFFKMKAIDWMIDAAISAIFIGVALYIIVRLSFDEWRKQNEHKAD